MRTTHTRASVIVQSHQRVLVYCHDDINMSLVVGKRFPGFPAMSDTNRVAQPQKIARGLKFRIQIVEGLYYLCGENIGAGELHSYCAADLQLCFCICKKLVSHNEAHILVRWFVYLYSSNLAD